MLVAGRGNFAQKKENVSYRAHPFDDGQSPRGADFHRPPVACSTSRWFPCSFTLWKLMDWICLSTDLARETPVAAPTLILKSWRMSKVLSQCGSETALVKVTTGPCSYCIRLCFSQRILSLRLLLPISKQSKVSTAVFSV